MDFYHIYNSRKFVTERKMQQPQQLQHKFSNHLRRCFQNNVVYHKIGKITKFVIQRLRWKIRHMCQSMWYFFVYEIQLERY